MPRAKRIRVEYIEEVRGEAPTETDAVCLTAPATIPKEIIEPSPELITETTPEVMQ